MLNDESTKRSRFKRIARRRKQNKRRHPYQKSMARSMSLKMPNSFGLNVAIKLMVYYGEIPSGFVLSQRSFNAAT